MKQEPCDFLSWEVQDNLVTDIAAGENGAFSYVIKPDKLSVGQHTIKVVANDGELESTKETVFMVTNTLPVFDIDVSAVYYKDETDNILLKPSIIDENIGQQINLSYTIDNSDEISLSPLNATGDNQEIEISIPTESLEIGNHTISFKISDGICDDIIETKTFSLEYAPAPPSIKASEKNISYYADTEVYTTTYDIADINNDDITVDVMIDNKYLASAFYDFDGSKLTVNIPTAKYDIGNHVLKITASDKDGSEVTTTDLQIINNKPTMIVDFKDYSEFKIGDVIKIPIKITDNDYNQKISASYSLNDSDPINFNSLSENAIIIDTQNLSVGTHKIIITASDGYDDVSEELSFDVYKENIAPNLALNPISNQSIDSVDSPMFTVNISGQITDEDNNPISIDYVLSKNNTEIERGAIAKYSNSGIIPVDFSHSLKGLTSGTYTIEIFASDGEVSTSQKQEFQLNWNKLNQSDSDENPTGTNQCPELYIKSYDGAYTGELKVLEKDLERVSIYCEIDNSQKYKLATIISDGKERTIEFDLREELEQGTHTITFYAVDADANYSNYDGDILYTGSNKDANKIKTTIEDSKEAPILYATQNTLKITNDEQVEIPFSYIDYNSGQKISIYYYIDDNFPVLHNTILSTGELQHDNIIIPTLEEGEHTIHIYAVDGTSLKSSSKIYNSINAAITSYLSSDNLSDVVNVTVSKKDALINSENTNQEPTPQDPTEIIIPEKDIVTEKINTGIEAEQKSHTIIPILIPFISLFLVFIRKIKKNKE